VYQLHEWNRTEQTRSANRYLKYLRYGNRAPYFPELLETVPWPTPPGTTAAGRQGRGPQSLQEIRLEGLIGGPDGPHLAHQVWSDLERVPARLPAGGHHFRPLRGPHVHKSLYLAEQLTHVAPYCWG